MSSSPQQSAKKRKTWTAQQKAALIAEFAAAHELQGMKPPDFARDNGIAPNNFNQWLRAAGWEMRARGDWRPPKPRSTAVVPAADHERDIAALAALNSGATRHAPPAERSSAEVERRLDERVGTVLGSAIAEIITRLKGAAS